MLSVTLPPINPATSHDLTEAAEAFMYSYLAPYATAGLSARTVQSYARSFGVSSLFQTSRVVDGKPGYVIGVYTGEGVRRIIVGIEGATSLVQIGIRLREVSTATPTGLSGRVYALWNTYANEIYAELAALDLFTNPAANANTHLTFSGFSLGAVVAEILAYRFKLTHTFPLVSLFKYASMRVGNQRWVDGRNAQVPIRNFYIETDPAHLFPTMAATSIANTFESVPSIWANFQEDPVVTRLDQWGGAGGPMRSSFGAMSRVHALSNIPLTLDMSNPWFWHRRLVYRYAFTKWAASNNPLTLLRLRGVEHNDENNFGTVGPYQGNISTFTPALVDPIPGDIGPDGETRPMIDAGVPQNRFVERNVYAPDTRAEVGGGGDGWDVVDPSRPRFRFPRRRGN